MTTSREQFEEWFDEYTFSAPGRCKTLRSGIGYRNTACQEQWGAWQASREAIEITLPDCDDYQSTWQYRDAAEARIKEQGVSVK